MIQPSTIAYFGYGSLVNLATLRTPYISAHRARLTGWRRVWLTHPQDETSFISGEGQALLSVEPDEKSMIEGIVVIDHQTSLPALDKREALYERENLLRKDITFLDGDPLEADAATYMYVANHPLAGKNTRILRSYLDAVMQGFLTHFDVKGVEDFMRSTANFDCCMLEDRDAPNYPRSVELTTSEKELFNKMKPELKVRS